MSRDEGWVNIEGSRYQLIRYGGETVDGEDVFATPCNVCGAAPNDRHRDSCTLGNGNIYARPGRCRDCGVPIGSIHVLVCGIEQCPRCLGQYASCSCESDEDGPGGEE